MEFSPLTPPPPSKKINIMKVGRGERHRQWGNLEGGCWGEKGTNRKGARKMYFSPLTPLTPL